MAITNTSVLSASRLRIKCRADSDASGGTGQISNATLIAALPSGPLHSLLAASYASLSDLLIASTSSNIASMYVIQGTSNPVVISAELGLSGNSAILLIGLGASSGSAFAIAELVYNHTMVR